MFGGGAGVNEWSARSEGFSAMSGAVGERRADVRVRPPVEECMSVGADVKAGLRRWWSPYEREADVGYRGGDVAAVLRGELERVDPGGGAGVGPRSPPPVPVVPSVPPPVAKARHLYAIGGLGEKAVRLDRVERYDLVSGEWETLASMGEKRVFSGAAVVRDRVCVAGGYDGSTGLSSCTMYDATANTWCTLPAMNKGRFDHGLVSVDDDHLYAFGGYGLSCVERLDMGSVLDGGWSVKWIMCPGVMLNGSGFLGRSAFGYCSIGGRGDDRDDTYIYCIGGHAVSKHPGLDVQRYSVRRGEWEPLAPLPDSRYLPSVICVRGGEEEGRRVITVVGGSGRENREAIVMRSESNGSFSASGKWKGIDADEADVIGVPLNIQRQDMGTAVINGHIVLVGGDGGNGVVESDVVSCGGIGQLAVPNMPLGGRSRVVVAVV